LSSDTSLVGRQKIVFHVNTPLGVCNKRRLLHWG
jgi:hypothetical protein